MAASAEAAGSYWFQPLAGGLCSPLGCCGPVRPATTAAYASPPLVGSSCRLLSAASSPVELWAAGPSPNRFPCAGQQLEGSDRPSGLESSSAFLLFTGSCGVAGGHSLTPVSAQTLEDQSACSDSLGAGQGLLLASRYCFPQLL